MEVCQCCGNPIVLDSLPAIPLKRDTSYEMPVYESWVTHNLRNVHSELAKKQRSTRNRMPKIKSLERNLTRKKNGEKKDDIDRKTEMIGQLKKLGKRVERQK